MAIDLATARLHVKSDGDDDVLLQLYLNAATPICEGYCNRKFYEDQAALNADFQPALDDLVAAKSMRAAAVATAPDGETLNLIQNRYIAQLAAVKRRINGCVVDGTIDAAVLLVTGHLYFNRVEVVVGQYSAVQQLPAGARDILAPYLWIGDLAGVDDCDTGNGS